MPICEYRCPQCGARFEKSARLSTRRAEIERPRCGARKAQKAVSRLGLPLTDKRLSPHRAGRSVEPVASEGRRLSGKPYEDVN